MWQTRNPLILAKKDESHTLLSTKRIFFLIQAKQLSIFSSTRDTLKCLLMPREFCYEVKNEGLTHVCGLSIINLLRMCVATGKEFLCVFREINRAKLSAKDIFRVN